jgi:putative transposase
MVIIDLNTRKAMGWSQSDNSTMRDTIINAWAMAVKSNEITGVFRFE